MKHNRSDHVDIMAVNGTLTDIQLIRRKAVFIFITHENVRYMFQHFNNHNSCKSRPLNGAQHTDARAKQILVSTSASKE